MAPEPTDFDAEIRRATIAQAIDDLVGEMLLDLAVPSASPAFVAIQRALAVDLGITAQAAGRILMPAARRILKAVESEVEWLELEVPDEVPA